MTQRKILTMPLNEIYLDWVNNFVTIQNFAIFYGISRDQAVSLLRAARDIREGN